MEPFSIPDNISELSAEDLSSLHDRALAEFQTAFEVKPRTTDSMDRMRSLAADIETIKAARASMASEAEAEELAATVLAADEPPVEEEEEAPPASAATEPAAEDGEPAPEEEPAPEAAPEAEPEPEPEPAPAEDPETTESTPDPEPADDEPAGSESQTEETATVAASANTPSAGTPSAAALNANRDEDTPVEATLEPASKPKATIVAAANVPSYNAGVEMTRRDLAEAFIAKARTFPKGNAPGQMQAGLAVIKREHDFAVRDGQESLSVLDAAVDQSRLPGGNLIAAGGWCAPSETMYDLVTHEEVSGILSIPSVGVTRGGIRHTLGPDFRTIYDGTGFSFTEADDIAGDYQPANGAATGKPCAVVPCPSFTEDRLDVAGLCITGGILQDVAYPEMTERFIDGSLVGHAHRINSLLLDALVAGSDAVAPTAFGGATVSLLSAIELVGTDVRYRHRMGENTILEVVLPVWAKGLVRADLSNRLGINMLDVTDEQINAWFRQRKVAVQYVYDWQDDMIDGSGFGGAAAITAWPTTVDFLIYPAGTWVKGESDIITVDAIYDSVNLPANNYTALFTEEGWMAMKRSHDSRVVTVTGFGPMGDANLGSTT